MGRYAPFGFVTGLVNSSVLGSGLPSISSLDGRYPRPTGVAGKVLAFSGAPLLRSVPPNALSYEIGMTLNRSGSLTRIPQTPLSQKRLPTASNIFVMDPTRSPTSSRGARLLAGA